MVVELLQNSVQRQAVQDRSQGTPGCTVGLRDLIGCSKDLRSLEDCSMCPRCCDSLQDGARGPQRAALPRFGSVCFIIHHRNSLRTHSPEYISTIK